MRTYSFSACWDKCFSGIYINMSCNKIIDKIEQIDVSSHRNDMESAAKTASELMDDWEKFNKIASLLIHNDKLTEAQFFSCQDFAADRE